MGLSEDAAVAGPRKKIVKPPPHRQKQAKHPEQQQPITMLPMGRKFAVVRMDPVSMVSHLGLDSLAVEEARAMAPKKYLVYIESPQDLPLPESQWCRYWIQPIATTVRPAVPEKGITSDMVLPIYPNTRYAKGRQPVQSSPQFPFPDCYFWIQSTMSLRIRVKRGADGYDNDNATTVSMARHTALRTAWNEDSLLMYALRSSIPPRSSTSPSPDPIPREAAHHAASLAMPTSPPSLREYPDSITSSEYEEDSLFDRSNSTSSGDGPASPPALPPVPPLLEMAIDTNVFGWAADPKVPFIPLVDLWFELEDHLSLDTIPSPTELWREQELIGTIIEAALRRRSTSTTPPQTPPPLRGDPETSGDSVAARPHAAVRSSRPGPRPDTDSSTRPDEERDRRLDSTPPSRRQPSPARASLKPRAAGPVVMPKPDSGEVKEDARTVVTPATSYASLLRSKSMSSLGHHVASWPHSRPHSPAVPQSINLADIKAWKRKARNRRQRKYVDDDALYHQVRATATRQDRH